MTLDVSLDPRPLRRTKALKTSGELTGRSLDVGPRANAGRTHAPLEGCGESVHRLDDGRRVVSQRGVVGLLSGGAEVGNLGRFMSRLPSRFAQITAEPKIEFDLPGGGVAYGREGTWLVDLLTRPALARQRPETGACGDVARELESSQPIARAPEVVIGLFTRCPDAQTSIKTAAAAIGAGGCNDTPRSIPLSSGVISRACVCTIALVAIGVAFAPMIGVGVGVGVGVGFRKRSAARVLDAGAFDAGVQDGGAE
jgi:hypothetical protein